MTVHRGPYTRLPDGRIDCEIHRPDLGPGDGGFHPCTLASSDPLTAELWSEVSALPEIEDLPAADAVQRARNAMVTPKPTFIMRVYAAGWISEDAALAWAEGGAMPEAFDVPFADRVAFAASPNVLRMSPAVAAIGAGRTGAEIDALFTG